MANVIDSLLISIGLDANELASGLEKAQRSVTVAVEGAAAGFDKMADVATDSSREAGKALDRAGDQAKKLGTDTEKGADMMRKALHSVVPVVDTLKGTLGSMLSAFLLAVGGSETFSAWLEKSEELGKLSDRLGIAVDDLDAFGKAAESMGADVGSVFASMEGYFEATGRPAKEVFQLASRVEGMSKTAATRFLQARGVAADAIPVFLQGQEALDALMTKYRETAFTAQDAKTARAFKTAWLDFKTAAMSVGSILARLVVPVITAITKGLTSVVTVIRENLRFFTLFGTALAIAFGMKDLGYVKDMVAAIKAFGLAVKGAFLPITALVALIGTLALVVDDLMVFAEGGDSVFEGMLKGLGYSAAEIEALRDTVRSLGASFGKLWDYLKPLFSGAVKIAFNAAGAAIATVVRIVEGLVVGILKLIDASKEVGEYLSAKFSELKAKSSEFAESVGQWFSGVPDAIMAALSSAWEGVKAWFSGWKDLIAEYITGPIGKIFSSISGFTGGDDGKASGVRSASAGIAAQKAAYEASAPSYSASSTMNVTNNITTRDDPKAIGQAVGTSVTSAGRRNNTLLMQSVTGMESM